MQKRSIVNHIQNSIQYVWIVSFVICVMHFYFNCSQFANVLQTNQLKTIVFAIFSACHHRPESIVFRFLYTLFTLVVCQMTTKPKILRSINIVLWWAITKCNANRNRLWCAVESMKRALTKKKKKNDKT